MIYFFLWKGCCFLYLIAFSSYFISIAISKWLSYILHILPLPLCRFMMLLSHDITMLRCHNATMQHDVTMLHDAGLSCRVTTIRQFQELRPISKRISYSHTTTTLLYFHSQFFFGFLFWFRGGGQILKYRTCMPL